MSLFRRRLLIQNALRQQGGGGGENEGVLPAGYTQLEYIENKNTYSGYEAAYIITDVIPTDRTGVKVIISTQARNTTYIAGATGSSGIHFDIPYAEYDNTLYYSWNKLKRTSIVISDLSALYDIEFNYKNNRVVKLNNSIIAEINEELGDIDEPLYIFSSNFKGTSNIRARFAGRIYSCEITDGGKVIRDFVPCISDKGEVGLFDLVQQKMYKSSGETEFTAGGYIKFEDKEVERICVAKFSSDDVGVTYGDAEKVKNIDTIFNSNKKIKKFNEFQYFTSCTSVPSLGFERSTIEDIILPQNIITIGAYAFNCSLLKNINNLPTSITDIYNYAFSFTKINIDITLPNLKTLGGCSFAQSYIKKVKDLGTITTLQNLTFSRCGLLKYIALPSTLKTIDQYALEELTLTTLVCNAVIPPTIKSNSFAGTSIASLYVPDESVEAYKTAPNWSTYADKIKPLSEYVPQ